MYANMRHIGAANTSTGTHTTCRTGECHALLQVIASFVISTRKVVMPPTGSRMPPPHSHATGASFASADLGGCAWLHLRRRWAASPAMEVS